MTTYNELAALRIRNRENEQTLAAIEASLGDYYVPAYKDLGVNIMAERLQQARAEIERLRGRDRWVPVSERLPDYGREVLAIISANIGRFRDVAYLTKLGWYRMGGIALSTPVTHWQPLPALPAGPTSEAAAEAEHWPDCSGAIEAAQ